MDEKCAESALAACEPEQSITPWTCNSKLLRSVGYTPESFERAVIFPVLPGRAIVMANSQIQDCLSAIKRPHIPRGFNCCWAVYKVLQFLNAIVYFYIEICSICGEFFCFGSVVLPGKRSNEKNIGFSTFIFWCRGARLHGNYARRFPRCGQFKNYDSLQR